MNSKLIQLFIEYNPSIRPFMVLIQYWASFYELCGAVDQANQISNYALNMLMIFYLERQGILPSLKSLQENLKKEDSMIIDNLQCGYPKNVLEWPQLNGNGKSMISLVDNFFKFYATYEYDCRKICCYSGNLTKKKYPNFSCLHVNDLFDRNRNLTSGYTRTSLKKWKKYCTETAIITVKFLIPKLQVEPNRGILEMFVIKPVT